MSSLRLFKAASFAINELASTPSTKDQISVVARGVLGLFSMIESNDFLGSLDIKADYLELSILLSL